MALVGLAHPVPGGLDVGVGVFVLGFPAEDGFGFGGVADEFGGVAGAAGAVADGDGFAGDFFGGGDDFFDGEAAAGAEVDGGAFAAVAEVGECEGVGGGEVVDVDVVADAGAVGGGVVGAEDGDGVDVAPDGHEDAGDKVGFGVVVFADAAVEVAAAGVEVAEEDGLEAEGGFAVAEDAFEHEFAGAVGVDGVLWVGLVHGHEDGVTVGGAGGGEDEAFAGVFLHGFEESEGAGDVVAVVFEGVFDGFADVAVGGEVEDGFGLVLGEDLVEEGGVVEVALDEGDAVVGEGVEVAVDEVVEDDDGFAEAEEVLDGVGADVAGAAGDEERGT